jgi:hypothetical protein
MRRLWKIEEGPVEVRSIGDSDDWIWVLKSETEEECRVRFRRTGTAGAMTPTALPPRVMEAAESKGQTELEKMLGWPVLPAEIVAGSDRLTLTHRNGTWSHIGPGPATNHRDPVQNALALLRHGMIAIDYRLGVRFEYEFMGEHWIKRSLQNGRQRRDPEVYLLTDVLAELDLEDDKQRARDSDPRGAAAMPPAALLVKA